MYFLLNILLILSNYLFTYYFGEDALYYKQNTT